MAAHSSLFPNDLPQHLTQAAMAEEVVNWLNKHPNLGIHPNSRIPALCKVVQGAAGRESMPGDSNYVELIQSFKEVQELWLIIRVLGDRLLAAPFLEPLQRAAGNDPCLPEDSGQDTTGRDAQFELFVGATGDRVGFRVSHLGAGQPDWLMAIPLRKWSVETKRVKSSEAVNRQVKKAADQIQQSMVGGVIAVDVSAVGGPELRRLQTCLPDIDMESARNRMGDAIKKDGLPRIMKMIGDAPVGLVIVHDHLIRPSGRKPNGELVPWGLHGMWWAYFLVSPDSPQYARYAEFWDLWQRGLPNL